MVEGAAAFIVPAPAFPHRWQQHRLVSASASTQEHRRPLAAASTTVTPPQSAAVAGGEDGAPRRSMDELLTEIRAHAGTPKVLSLLKEAVAATGTGEVKKELFKAIFPFPLDDFQLKALEALGQRENVVVSAPTGSGKTVAGELAIYYALALGLRVFYTTPLKALSNQKFSDFCRQFGAERVGLLTGDTNINRGAQVTIMTTEVYRNMLYTGDEADLQEVFAVVFDEFHYMNDPDRGTVWEESVILSPPHILFVALSATIANVDQVAGWIGSVHGPTQMVVSDFRPVPLKYHFIDNEGIYRLFDDEEAGPGAPKGLKKLVRAKPKGMMSNKDKQENGGKGGDRGKAASPLIHSAGGKGVPMSEVAQPINDFLRRRALRERRLLADSSGYGAGKGSGAFGKGGGNRRGGPPGRDGNRQPDGIRFTAWYRDVVEALAKKELLPAIVFIFSRAGCDRAAAEVGGIASKLGLLSPKEKDEVKERLQAFRRANPQVPLEKERVRLLLSGLATHHAGLLPVYKALIEELFNDNLVKVVFATETLAAGVNMPARATVISTISKKLGKTVVKLMPSQLLQMAGRAGRRGKDTQGHVVLMRSRSEDALDAFDLLCAPVDAIRSHFRSSYAMVVNILRTRDLESCRVLVERSFGNYLKAFGLGREQEEDEARVKELKGRLGGVDPGELRMYEDMQEKLAKAKRAERNLRREQAKLEEKYVKAVLGAVRMGAPLLLRDGRTLALVGEASLPHPLTRARVDLTVGLSQNGKLVAVPLDQIRSIDSEASSSAAVEGAGLDVETAFRISAVLGEEDGAGGGAGLLWRPQGPEGTFVAEPVEPDSEEAQGLLEYLREQGARIAAMPPPPVPPEVERQRQLVTALEEQLALSPLHATLAAAGAGAGDPGGASSEAALESLLAVRAELDRVQKRVARRARTLKGVRQKEWDDFLAAVDLLESYGALVDTQQLGRDQPRNLQPSGLGQLVGTVRAENELWASLVLLSDGLADMEAVDLVGVISALANDITKTETKVTYSASEVAEAHIASLLPLREQLLVDQQERGLSFPCPLDPLLAGVAQCWLAGFSWRELVETTNLDQGDVCRHIRKARARKLVIDALRQIPVLPRGLVPERLKNTARDAADRMDRFPVADDVAAVRSGVPSASAAEAEGEGSAEAEQAAGAAEGEEGAAVLDDDEEVEVETYEVTTAWEAQAGPEEEAIGGGQQRDEMAELMAALYPEGSGERPPRKRVRGPQQQAGPTPFSRGGGVTPVFNKKVEKVTRGELRRRREQERADLAAAAVAAAQAASKGAAALLDGVDEVNVDVEAEERRLQEEERLEEAAEAWREMVLAAKAKAAGKAEEEVEKEAEELDVAEFLQAKQAERAGEGLESFLKRAVVLGGEPDGNDEDEDEEAELVEGFKVVDPAEYSEEDLAAFASAASGIDFEEEARLYEEGRYGTDHGEFEGEAGPDEGPGGDGGLLGLDVDADDPLAVREAQAAVAAATVRAEADREDEEDEEVEDEAALLEEEEEEEEGHVGIDALDEAPRSDQPDVSLFEELMATLEAAPTPPQGPAKGDKDKKQ